MLARADAALLIGDPALFADHRALGAREDGPRRGLDGDDRPAVRLGVLGGPAGRPPPPVVVRCCRRPRASGRAHLDEIADRATRPARVRAGRLARRYLREHLMFDLTPRALDGLRDLLPRGAGARRGRRASRDSSSLTRASPRGEQIAGMTVDDVVRDGGRRRAADAGDRAHAVPRGADGAARPAGRRRAAPRSIPEASSPTSSTATSTTRTCAWRAASSARSTGRSARPRATRSASTRSSRRSKRRSRSAAGSCCCRAGTIRTCRSTWYEDLFRGVKTRYPDVPAARAVAARSHPHLAAVAAAGAGGDRSAHRRGPRQHSRRRRGDPRRSRAQASSTATTRPPPTSGSTSCATRIAPACARRRR